MKLNTVLPRRVVQGEPIEPAAAVLLRLEPRQQPVRMPHRRRRTAMHPADDDRPIAIATHESDEHFVARAHRKMPPTVRPGCGETRSHPARGLLVALI